VRLIDAHCHVQADAFDAGRDQVIAAAHAAGVERILVPGWDLASSRAAVALAARANLHAAAGIHPHVARDGARDLAAIADLARDPLVVAVGETGLDYDRDFSPRDDQLTNLRHHLRLARDLDKPAVLHCRSKPGMRDAHDDLLRLLDEEGRPPALLHSFSGPVDYAERALAMGLAISFSGLVFRSGEDASAEVARLVPAERLLVETDAPYLSPPGTPRRRNEPQYVALTAAWLAAQRHAKPGELGDQLVANYDLVFRRPIAR
jgi:TatD DNase family protein